MPLAWLHVDWYLDPSDGSAPAELRDQIATYLTRHAEPDSDVEGALLAAWELVGNALRHAQGPVWVSLDWSGPKPLLRVHDLGPGFSLSEVLSREPRPEGGWGLRLVTHLTQDLRVAAKRAGGSVVSTVLPIRRPTGPATPVTIRSSSGDLPLPSEAGDEGTFGLQPFLRALTVQFAQSVELSQGPQAAEDAVVATGIKVGGRMEEAYRSVRQLGDRLTPEQMADLFVRLKAAIGGGFRVVEVAEDHIVLENTTCPFGEVVRYSPALCRMTSSVFGGIAARNTGGSRVVLEERIAVGDPGCRVVVWLGPAAAEPGEELGHRYRVEELPIA